MSGTVKLPSALRRRRAEIDAAANAPAPAPIAQNPDPAVDPQPAPAPVVDPQTPTAEQTLQTELTRLRDEIRELRAAQSVSPVAPAPAPVPAEPETEFTLDVTPTVPTDSERERYGAADNYIRSVVEETIARVVAPIVTELNALRKQFKGVSSGAQELAARVFQENLRANIPNFKQILEDSSFREFIKQESPTGRNGQTIQQDLRAAYEAQDLARIMKIFRMWKPETVAPAAASVVTPPSVTTTSPSKPSTDALRQPTPQGGRAVPTNTPNQPKFTMSQRTADFNAFRSGKMDAATWRAKQALYTQADIEGRFDHAS